MYFTLISFQKSILHYRVYIDIYILSTYTVNEHTFQKANNSLKVFFLLVLWSILICWDSELVGFC